MSDMSDRLRKEAGYEDDEYPEPDEYCSARGGDFSRAVADRLDTLEAEVARLTACHAQVSDGLRQAREGWRDRDIDLTRMTALAAQLAAALKQARDAVDRYEQIRCGSKQSWPVMMTAELEAALAAAQGAGIELT